MLSEQYHHAKFVIYHIIVSEKNVKVFVLGQPAANTWCSGSTKHLTLKGLMSQVMVGRVIESKVGCPKMARVCTDFAICTVPYSPSLVFNLGYLGILISAKFPGNSPQDRDIMSSTSNKANKVSKSKKTLLYFFSFYNRIVPLRFLPQEIHLAGKAGCDRVELPNLWCMLGVLVFP